MKKMKILFLTFILIITTAIPAFALSPPVIVQPITVTPIINLPPMPVFLNQKSVSTIPLYRLYNSSINKHTYTSLTGEKNDLLADGWVVDGIVAYVSPVKLPNLYALHRYKSFGQTILTGISSPLVPWWTHTGIMGYISDEDDYLTYAGVHESTRAIEEGESPFDGDLYYSSDQKTFMGIPYGPDYPEGYNLTNNSFTMWRNSTVIQSINLGGISANLIGGSNLHISWTNTSGGGKVKLMYSSDNGASWYTIAEDLNNPPVHGAYTWTVPNSTNSEMKLRILWMAESGESATAWDTSETFSITADPGIITLIPIDPGINILTLMPATPTNLSANAGMISKEINLYWTDNSATETGYSIERKIDGGLFAEIVAVDINETSYTDTAIASNVMYTYRVKAKGAILDSKYSNEVEAKHTGLIAIPLLPDGFIMPDFPDPPENVTATFTDGSNSEVLITWDPPTGDFTGFKVEKNSGAGWVELGNTTEDDHNYVDVDLAGLSGLIFYRVKTYDEALTSTPAEPVFVNLDNEEPEEPGPVTPTDLFDGSQSGWAESEILEAYNNGLTYPGILYDYDRAITREEFCTLAVKLYEELTGLNPVPGTNPFNDTNNPEVLKAYSLGIINGISATQFAPAYNVTRQEMCVMLYRALDAAGRNISVDPTAAFPFTDYADIASWAINEVKFCNQNGIMNGTSPTTIDPLLNTPREQAIILVGRTYNEFVSP
jgi:hypothetical protein